MTRRRHVRYALLPLLTSAALTACGDATRPEAALVQLQFARTRWAAAGPSAYRFVLFRGCECLPEWSGPVAVAVRNGAVESRTYTGTGKPVDAHDADLFPEVEGLFRFIEDAAGRRAARMEVKYHPILGYPFRIFVDYDGVGGNDDEILYDISVFER